jgi:hypothetical protein
MGEDEIVLTNTFLNSRKKGAQEGQRARRRRKTLKTLSWREGISHEHVYNSSTVIAHLGQPRTPTLEQKPRSDSVNSKKQEN